MKQRQVACVAVAFHLGPKGKLPWDGGNDPAKLST
jgi:hypothetical protein